MNMPICSRCKKNVAVVFVTRMEGDKSQNEGLCLKCARELGIQPVTQMLQQFGISDEDLETMSEELLNGGGEMMQNMMQQLTGQPPQSEENEEDENGAGEDLSSRAPSLSLFQVFRNQKDQEREPEEKSDGKSRKQEKKEGKKKKFLSGYAQNLTQKAKDGKLDRVVGRDSETLRVIQILNRRQKNNPCLIGEPGVGKTAVAEGLAQRIAAGDVPAKLQGKEVWLLDMTATFAGHTTIGQKTL